jgi:hypothetical protein
MADRHHFSEDFLRRCESNAIDDNLVQELLDLTPEQRSELAQLLIARKVRRAGKNGDPVV